MHHLRVTGDSDLLARPPAGPLIILANHTADIDPVLIQTRCSRPIRWIMAEDMRMPSLEWFWNLYGIIFVDRNLRRAGGLRTAIAHLRAGGVVGIFPEGGLERPPEHLRPFGPGIGVLIQRTGAPVLPVVVRGTPRVGPAWASLWRTSHSTIEVAPIIPLPPGNPRAASPRRIAQHLQDAFQSITGWPLASPASHDPGADRPRHDRG